MGKGASSSRGGPCDVVKTPGGRKATELECRSVDKASQIALENRAKAGVVILCDGSLDESEVPGRLLTAARGMGR
ncbi:hypothetical protein GCM10009727_11290 [Actinomadura napierensis]|uniref:Uncharacterized protein n=1 Tax=Actinomadura napierensis TaxID=267854 RepID=A0ABN2YBK5_9ACTN